ANEPQAPTPHDWLRPHPSGQVEIESKRSSSDQRKEIRPSSSAARKDGDSSPGEAKLAIHGLGDQTTDDRPAPNSTSIDRTIHDAKAGASNAGDRKPIDPKAGDPKDSDPKAD